MRASLRRLLALPLVFAGAPLAACTGSTGGELIAFEAFLEGPALASADAAYELETSRGYGVSLTRARMHVGAIYLNRSVPQLGVAETSCTLPGVYVAEVTEGSTFDVLAGSPQPFPALGDGTTDRVRAGELWLNGGPVDAETDPTVVLDIAGTATAPDGAEYPFAAELTIGDNRKRPPDNPALPGSNPICKERIVTPILADFVPSEGGRLVVEVDPAAWVDNVDFALLECDRPAACEPPPCAIDDESAEGDPEMQCFCPCAEPRIYRFRDDNEGQPNLNLYRGLKASRGAYRFRWEKP